MNSKHAGYSRALDYILFGESFAHAVWEFWFGDTYWIPPAVNPHLFRLKPAMFVDTTKSVDCGRLGQHFLIWTYGDSYRQEWEFGAPVRHVFMMLDRHGIGALPLGWSAMAHWNTSYTYTQNMPPPHPPPFLIYIISFLGNVSFVQIVCVCVWVVSRVRFAL